MIKKALLVYGKMPDPIHQKTVRDVKRFLQENEVFYSTKERSGVCIPSCKGYDLVIVVGGDGTFLRAANGIRDKTPLFGINSNPKKKEGFFMLATKDDFQEKWRSMLDGDFKIRKLARLEAILNGKTLDDLALNEFYVGYRDTTLVARYELKMRGKKEVQRSSGILVGTASGSYGWIKSAGGVQLPLGSRKFQVVVREPINARTAKATITQAVLNPTESIMITSLMRNGVIIVDGQTKDIAFDEGNVLTIRVSSRSVSVIVL
ncbi:NAD(+)/NADH kinase [Candidatus Woesearchaeota archaeon]|nr:NAD(+)/NADH kinase [Candidatus Woesearchaeota archaeon]